MEMSKSDIKELFSKHWPTHDAMGYGTGVMDLGPAVANRLNQQAVKSMAAIEIKRILILMGIPNETRLASFDALAEMIETAFAVVKTRFMKFDIRFPEKNVMQGTFHECFAHDGAKRYGMIET